MKSFYILAFIMLILSAVFARREYFENPTTPSSITTIITPTSEVDISGNAEITDSAQLLRDIRSTIRNELLSNKAITSNTSKSSICKEAPSEISQCIQQGAAFNNANPAQQKPFDMNMYIRKDSIPCHACTLDY
jgi:hypothetical protein